METILNKDDFKACFETTLSPYVIDKIEEYHFVHRSLDAEEQYYCMQAVFSELDKDLTPAGSHRVQQWEMGWGENLASDSILPKYFGKHDILRWKQLFIKPISHDYEINMLHLIVDWLADKYMRDADAIYEFGCGTGHNLQRVRLVNTGAMLIGLDWATSSQELIKNYANKYGDKNLVADKFDFFNPDYDINILDNSVVLTVASLEQTGEMYVEFLDYLLYQKPRLCIHIEPIGELLDGNNILDYLSLRYFKKRNYLSGFLTCLRELESKGHIEIMRAQRTYIGSLFIDGYSVIVWKPK